jgi:UTP--glucose-1-phosphate uridylyltransferase
MINQVHISKKIIGKMKEQGVNVDLATAILNNYNNGEYDSVRPIRVKEIPEVDGRRIIDIRGTFTWRCPRERALENIHAVNPSLSVEEFGRGEGDDLVFSREDLEMIGEMLLPYVSYGILNGGSATSYVDEKKNKGYQHQLFEEEQDLFERFAGEIKDKSKGITSGFVQADGTPGPSFIELKMRNLLIQALRYKSRYGTASLQPVFPMFQMTSIKNNDEITGAYEGFAKSPFLKPLIDAANCDSTDVLTGIQPLLAAYTHSEEGRPKFIFTAAYGKKDAILPLPGGHGQNFFVLAGVYRELFSMGKRFVYLTNVDNLGSTVDPVEVAMLALSGRKAGFDFSFKTPVDIKGGILVRDAHYGLTTGDIGPAVSAEEVAEQESAGKNVLFNCGTGLFNLQYVTENLDTIARELPVRFSDQNKDAGKYSQAEQVTWEVQGMLDDFLGFAVDKYRRFLASKLLLENFLTSGIGIDSIEDDAFRQVAENLHQGLEAKLREDYGLKFFGGKWVPKTPAELAGA